MLIEATEPLRIKTQGREILLEPGKPVDLPRDRAEKLLRVASHSVRLVPPLSPILPGWLIAWRDRAGRLRGGCDDRAHGTVREAQWGADGWTFTLSSGEVVPMRRVVSVGRTDATGQLVASWEVRGCGLDGTSENA
jgi:hypothetical protein